jgi:hypothetical protein
MYVYQGLDKSKTLLHLRNYIAKLGIWGAKLKAAFETGKLATCAKVLPIYQHGDKSTDEWRQDNVFRLNQSNLQEILIKQ